MDRHAIQSIGESHLDQTLIQSSFRKLPEIETRRGIGLAAQTRPGKSAILLQQASGRSDVAHAGYISDLRYRLQLQTLLLAVADGKKRRKRKRWTLVAHPPDPPCRVWL